MMDTINAIKNILTTNFTINHTHTGKYQDFIAEDYPAVCLDPTTFHARLGSTLSFDYDTDDTVVVWYVEQAPENRDMTAYIQQVDSMVDVLMDNPRLNGMFNMGIAIDVEFKRRQLAEDNIEFISKIIIGGRNE